MSTLSKGFILTSQPNFRDLGGIPSRTGLRIRPRIIYRSGDLYNLPPEDVDLLEEMKLRMVVDFRAEREFTRRPDASILTVKDYKHIPIEDAAREKAMQMFDERNAVGLKNLLIEDYRRMVTEHTEEFRRFFSVLAEPGVMPLVFHCAAGKDRTGLAAWFLLSALDVPEEIIRRDYLETNLFSKSFADKIIRKTSENGIDGEIIRPLLEVRDEYIDAALEVIEKEFGGMERYLREVLKVDKQRLQYLVS